jgi:hypothetical protein
VERLSSTQVAEDPVAYGFTESEANGFHYTLWSKNGEDLGVANHRESVARWLRNPSSAADLVEIARWRRSLHPFPTSEIDLGYPCSLRLHAAYGYREITAAFGKATLATTGPAGVGVIHLEERKTYLHFVTFRKEERDFAPTTRYKDYPISRTRLHWESQAGTALASAAGRNYLHFRERGYKILFFARLEKNTEGNTLPFLFLGPAADLVSAQGDRPIKMIWDLAHPMPAELYEMARTV